MSSENGAATLPAPAISPRSPQQIPVSSGVIETHRQMLAANGPHALKDVMRDIDDPQYLFDVKAIERAIADKILQTRNDIWRTCYAAKAWRMVFEHNVLSQGEGSDLDLIWVATMPENRAATPVLVIAYESGPSLFDGAHRLARAFMDGHATHPSLVFRREDALAFRTLEQL